MKDIYIDKAEERSCLIFYGYNDRKKNIVPGDLKKISEFSEKL